LSPVDRGRAGFQYRLIIDGQWHHPARRVSHLAGDSHDDATPLLSLLDAVHPLAVGVESTPRRDLQFVCRGYDRDISRAGVPGRRLVWAIVRREPGTSPSLVPTELTAARLRGLTLPPP
jgi:hypothetical protein